MIKLRGMEENRIWESQSMSRIEVRTIEEMEESRIGESQSMSRIEVRTIGREAEV